MKKTILAVLVAVAAMMFSSCVVLTDVQDSGTRTEKSKPDRPGSSNSSRSSRSSSPDRPGNSNSSRSSKPVRP